MSADLSRAVLDANVLYPARLRDLFVRLAIAGLYQARWTDQILDECFSSIVANVPELSPDALARTRRLLAAANPDGLVVDYERFVDEVELPDPDDRHVLAAAIASEADVIVTSNLTDFPEGVLQAHGVEAVSPDDFVVQLIASDATSVMAVIVQQASALRHPPMTVEEVLDSLAVVGLDRSAELLRAHRS